MMPHCATRPQWVNRTNVDTVLCCIYAPWNLSVSPTTVCKEIPMLKIRRSCDRLIFNVGIPFLGKTVFILRQAPASHYLNQCCLLINSMLWHAPKISVSKMRLKNTLITSTSTSPRGQWVKFASSARTKLMHIENNTSMFRLKDHIYYKTYHVHLYICTCHPHISDCYMHINTGFTRRFAIQISFDKY